MINRNNYFELLVIIEIVRQKMSFKILLVVREPLSVALQPCVCS